MALDFRKTPIQDPPCLETLPMIVNGIAKLLVQHADDEGIVIHLNDKTPAKALRYKIGGTAAEAGQVGRALRTLARVGFLYPFECGAIQIRNYDKSQGSGSRWPRSPEAWPTKDAAGGVSERCSKGDQKVIADNPVESFKEAADFSEGGPNGVARGSERGSDNPAESLDTDRRPRPKNRLDLGQLREVDSGPSFLASAPGKDSKAKDDRPWGDRYAGAICGDLRKADSLDALEAEYDRRMSQDPICKLNTYQRDQIENTYRERHAALTGAS